MSESCAVDFTAVGEDDVAIHDLDQRTRVQTTSSCGNYYLIAKDAQIYIYQIDGLDLRLLTKLSCGTNVQVASLAANEHRFAVAAILDGRVGLYVDLTSTGTKAAVPMP